MNLLFGGPTTIIYIALSPGHSQFFNVTRRKVFLRVTLKFLRVTLKNWEWPGDEATIHVQALLQGPFPSQSFQR